MKKITALLLALVLILPAQAKDKDSRNEFSINYGYFTIPQFAYVFGGVLGAAFTLGHFTFDNTHMIGAAGVEYVHYVNGWLGFGAAAVCDYMTATAYSVDGDGNKTPNGKYDLGYLSAMPVVKFAWLNRDHVGLYSKLAVGAGYSFANGDDVKSNISWSGQITPLGVDFGGQSFRGFVEAGVGMQGVVNAGIRWLF
ncbi:MAG: hypothetical protein J6Y80_01085 [Victivallales bacterium]|nr:hypothetical protein [Victivallales bacterium]